MESTKPIISLEDADSHVEILLMLGYCNVKFVATVGGLREDLGEWAKEGEKRRRSWRRERSACEGHSMLRV